ncbi:CHLTR phosphoprotein [Chlamydia trachomatis]|uniref:CHLTR possible phosphoprotein n=3 Tax=Chlamydia trachomatis TaxID=813 RepID=O84749_CHLTR|nr:hypothetical protein [Chlamydia trachomatis]NP_220263.1 hypothetical protein CT_744 [Chlamydia trachomatis D/UW-3/CX]AAC68339.1 CHLTR possible phosphoprotein [Chlamydia trachomatis D/UW-3/CX]ADH19390.1 CHLTR phosphoprotein [Chlamydia trachomatis G/11222]AGT70274.1 CHLTR phosphoprotein [Chlamydia trachomatis]AKR32921.1 CHLTR phosphoprotein [Chlamydia trachomatis D/CS637/11]AKR41777.1 CHLTR phosphoprotein [Chlamydia trachomatis]
MNIYRFISGSCSWFLIGWGICFGADVPLSFGHQCADVRKAMQEGKPLLPIFDAFIRRIVNDSSSLSEKDWETATWLICEYIRGSLKRGEQELCSELVKPLFSLAVMPPQSKARIKQVWQVLNPQGASLKDLVRLLESSGCSSSPQDHLLLSLYNMTLHSSYENKKAEILFAREQKNYQDALRLCEELQENLTSGLCSPLSTVYEVEQAFLKRISLAIRWEQEKELQGSPSIELLLAYCSAEESYAEAVEQLIKKIELGSLDRSQEVDAILFAHALSKLPWEETLGEHELEVLISGGHYLTSIYSQHAYFSLLEQYFKKSQIQEISRLLDFGKTVFVETHKKYPEYLFFLGKYWFYLRDFSRAEEAFSSVIRYADRLGVSLAETYEYLGCLACYKGHYASAKEFFLKAYKGWGREDAGIGLYLLAVLEKDPILCQQVREQVSLSFSHQEFLKWMDRNFLPEPGKEGSSFFKVLGSSRSLSEEEFHGLLLKEMISRHHREKLSCSPIQRLVYDQLDREIQLRLTETLIQTEDLLVRRKLSLWRALYEGSLVSWGSAHQNQTLFEKSILQCFSALSQQDPSAIQQIAEAFSSGASLWQSSLRMVWAVSHTSENPISKAYSLGISDRPWGDRLYLLQYSLEQYLSGDTELLEYLTQFPELFPNSPLLPLVYYLQARGEGDPIRKIAWLTKALETFTENSLLAKEMKAWAPLYYLMRMDLAETYLYLGNVSKSQTLFEAIQEEWDAPHHPYVKLIDPPHIRVSLEMRWVSGLAHVYEAIQATEQRNALLISHIEKRFFQMRPRQEYIGKMLTFTSSLCRELLADAS